MPRIKGRHFPEENCDRYAIYARINELRKHNILIIGRPTVWYDTHNLRECPLIEIPEREY